MDMDTLLYLTWRTNKDLLSSTGNSAQYSVITLWLSGRKDGGKGYLVSLRWTCTQCWITNKGLLYSKGRELCSILSNNLMVTMGGMEDKG